MNIVESEIPFLVEARSCGCDNRKRSISYHFIESVHGLCLNRIEIILAQIDACERLLKNAKNEKDVSIIEKEILELKSSIA